jgi:hypothetical protein
MVIHKQTGEMPFQATYEYGYRSCQNDLQDIFFALESLNDVHDKSGVSLRPDLAIPERVRYKTDDLQP